MLIPPRNLCFAGGPPSAGLTEIPNVNVTLRLVISAEDLYRLSQNTSNAPTASLSFEQVMSAQGIVVRAALLSARVRAAVLLMNLLCSRAWQVTVFSRGRSISDLCSNSGCA